MFRQSYPSPHREPKSWPNNSCRVYLKNVTKNEVYTDATYIYNDEDTFQVGGVDRDATLLGDKFQVLTIGTDITRQS